MNNPRPEIFISATSADLRSYRQLIKEALLNIGCTPVEQSNFPPSASTVRDMLRKKIADCTAVVHVAGEVYGAEPTERAADEPRRSYTQIEYDIARELGKPVYVFICGSEFAYDPHEAESPELASLQATHREQLQVGDHLFFIVNSKDDLSLKIHQVQEQVEKLKQELRQSRKHLRLGLLVGLGTLCLLGGGLWFVNQRSLQQSEEIIGNQGRIAAVETELDKQRRYIKSVADAYTQQQSEIAELKLTDAEKFERALARVAASEGLPAEELKSAINLFVVAVGNDQDAPFIDRSLAEFAEQRFSNAAKFAGRAAGEARQERIAAETLAKAAEKKYESARKREYDALLLQSKALSSNRDHTAALRPLEDALEITSRESYPMDWAMLQFEIGNANNRLAQHSEGSLIAKYQILAIQNYTSASEVLTKAIEPDIWAKIQINLAITLSDRAMAVDAESQSELFKQAIEYFKAAAEVITKEKHGLEWASLESTRAAILYKISDTIEGKMKIEYLKESIRAASASLDIYTINKQPKEWAQAMVNKATSMSRLAQTNSPDRQLELLNESLITYRWALKVLKIIDDNAPERALVENNIGSVLRSISKFYEGEKKADLINEAIRNHHSALDFYTRDIQPQDWAATQNNLAAALFSLSELRNGSEKEEMVLEAIEAFVAAQEIYTRSSLPYRWALVQNNIASAYAMLVRGPEIPAERAINYARKSANARADALNIFTVDLTRELWLKMGVNAAAHYIYSGDLNKSERLLRAVLDEEPTMLMALCNLAHILLLQGKYDEAMSIYKRFWDDPKEVINGMTFSEAVEADIEEFKRFPHLRKADFDRMGSTLNELQKK